ncbi:galanin receptor 2a-like [Saccoglossus kowalevskii]|uniref:Galanin receptor type 2-like n=1 Tax=Saccoglossus kowalevskii TaxID=10224 RepID=A0ABM0GKE1_SACKO|nr:PREDICTED: galanin receptor type 2-like [Saccoglossus kowalevskii]
MSDYDYSEYMYYSYYFLSYVYTYPNGSNVTEWTKITLPDEPQRLESIIMPVLFTVTFAVGMAGNILVIVTVLIGKQRMNTTNIFICNLAVADLLLSVFCTPFFMTLFLLPDWIFGEFMCKLTNFLFQCTMFASIFTMVVMSFDRFLAVVYPIRSMKCRTPTFALGAIIVIWTLSVAGSMPYWIVYKTVTVHWMGWHTHCVDDWPNQRPGYNASVLVFGYMLPFLFITVIYLLMLKRLWGTVAPSSSSHDNVKSKKKVTKMVIMVVVVFGVCWLPHHIITMWFNFDVNFPFSMFTYVLRLVAMFLSAFNSCINPIIYAFMSENFRKSFKKTLTCYRRSNHVGTSMASTNPTGPMKNNVTTFTDECFNDQVV